MLASYYCIAVDYWLFFYTNRLVIGIISYFVAGLLVMKFYKKASGTDIIPNKGFWIAAPVLIKVLAQHALCIYI